MEIILLENILNLGIIGDKVTVKYKKLDTENEYFKKEK